MRRQVLTVVVAIIGVLPCSLAKPIGPQVLCETFPEATDCRDGQAPCTTCHTSPPARNSFGTRIETVLLPGVDRPLTSAQFSEALGPALLSIAADDADGDGFSNETELLAGTAPGDPEEFPNTDGCSGESVNPHWNVCGYDRAYVFRKVSLDVCGFSPSYEEFKSFKALFPEG